MHDNQFIIDDNDMVPYDEKPMTIQAAQRQINAILAGCNTTSTMKAFTNQARHKYDEFFSTNKNADCIRPVPPSTAHMYAKNDDHDSYLYHRWNDKKRKDTVTLKPAPAGNSTNSTTTAYAPIEIPVKDDPSVTPTLETLSTLETQPSDPTYNDTDAILNIMIWNQPIVEYKVPIRPNTRNRS